MLQDLTGLPAHVTVRPYKRGDRHDVLDITAVAFAGVCLDENVEARFGRIVSDWRKYKRDMVEHDLDVNPGDVLVAVIGRDVVGFISTRYYRHRATGHVAQLAVAPEHQGVGIGKALMQAAVEHLRNRGAKYLRIETLEQNERACRFYSGMGFEEVGRQVFYFAKLDRSLD